MIETSQPIQLQHDLGRFADLAALQAKYPTGRPGDFARLTSTETIFNWVIDAWVDTLVDASSLTGGAMTFDNTDPASLGNPPVGKSFSGTYNNLLWVRNESGDIYWAQDIRKIVDLSYGQSLMEIHRDRVKADSGNVYPNHGSFIMATLKEMDVLRKTKLLYAPFMGTKERISGVMHYATRGYSALVANDLTQTTELNQPYLRGNIAPNEIPYISNGNGEDKFLTHPNIAFSADMAWSITVVFNTNWTNLTGTNNRIGLFSGSSSDRDSIFLNHVIGVVNFRDSNSIQYNSLINSFRLIGKNSIVTITYSGSQISFYLNGNFVNSISSNTILLHISRLFSPRIFEGKCFYYRVQSGTLNADQVVSEAIMLRSWIPELYSVIMGSQEWATSNLDIVCTPMGNIIPEVQDSAVWAALTTPAWCYYNNDPANGAIYGKLYNWYAVKLLQDDIDSYNVANSSIPWGWKVPTESDFNTLATTLGGTAIAGGKMKMTGEDYWNSPNTGGYNSSGLSVLGSGYRGTDGIFSSFKAYSRIYGIDRHLRIDSNSTILNIYSNNQSLGLNIRLIKS